MNISGVCWRGPLFLWVGKLEILKTLPTISVVQTQYHQYKMRNISFSSDDIIKFLVNLQAGHLLSYTQSISHSPFS